MKTTPFSWICDKPITSAAVSGVGRSPTGLLPGSWVVGFFRDGYNAQDPIIMGSLAGIPQPHPISKKWADSTEGFYDPSEMYPSAGYSGEADTNRLAVGLTSAYENTIVKIKKLNSAVKKTWVWRSYKSYGAL